MGPVPRKIILKTHFPSFRIRLYGNIGDPLVYTCTQRYEAYTHTHTQCQYQQQELSFFLAWQCIPVAVAPPDLWEMEQSGRTVTQLTKKRFITIISPLASCANTHRAFLPPLCPNIVQMSPWAPLFFKETKIHLVPLSSLFLICSALWV